MEEVVVLKNAGIIVALLIIPALAGCLTPDALETEDPADPAGLLDDVDESAPHVQATFRVQTRAGGEVDVAGAMWEARDADAVVLLIHGSGGGRMGLFGPLTAPGYSVAHMLTTSGRTAVAIDLPGYGDTPGMDGLVGLEDYAFVIDQVADALRSGDYVTGPAADARAHDTVVGSGISMGGLLTDMTQGLFASFDGIVPTAWSHGRFSDEADRCWSYTTDDCPEDWQVWMLHFDNVDPAVIDAWEEEYDGSPMPFTVGASFGVWTACAGCWVYELRPLDDARPASLRPDNQVTTRIDVPVLNILGDEDFYYEGEDQHQQGEHYPNADFELLLLPDTGHAVFHHLNHREVHRAVLEWMDRHGF